MQFEETFDFDCSAATIMRMFGDGDFYREKYRRMGSPQPEFVETQCANGCFSISMRHDLDTSAFTLPALARKRLGNRVELTQDERWYLDDRSGHMDIHTASMPVEASIDLRVLERESGARLILHFDVRARLPVFASKVEKAVADGLLRRMRDELEETARMAPNYT